MKVNFTEADFLSGCKSGDAEKVRLFITAGMSPDVTDNPAGKTALILASESGSAEVVKILLDARANVEASTSKVVPPFDYGYGAHEDAKCEGEKDKHKALLFAAYSGHVEVIKILLKAGANPNKANDQWGNTALNIACNKAGIIKAAKKGGNEVGIFLYDGGADSHLTKLYGADLTEQVAFIKLRVDVYHGKPQYRVITGLLGKKEEGTVKALLDGGADPNMGNCNGTTPLTSAANHGNKEIIESLLKVGADCSKKNLFGKTALELARNPTIYAPEGYHSAVVNALTSSCR